VMGDRIISEQLLNLVTNALFSARHPNMTVQEVNMLLTEIQKLPTVPDVKKETEEN